MRGLCVAVLGLFLLGAASARAAEPTTYVFGTYYKCNLNGQDRADAIYKEMREPLLKKQVEAGNLVTYGWSKHWLGGAWRRLEYVVGNDLDKMMDARQAYIDALTKEHKKESDEFSGICTSHDDYLWNVGASSQAPTEVARNRGAYGVSTYFECTSAEAEADEIIKSVYAPVLNQSVKDGKIVSWSWIRHMMGGKYRRALVFDGADYKALLHYYPTMAEAINKAAPNQAERFGEICHSHTDYIWELTARN